MARLKSFSPEHLAQDAELSGFFQCPKCGLVWFGREDIQECPEARHGKPVHVAILCRSCDLVIPVGKFAAHLSSENHQIATRK